jgi:hypothetical protein
MEGNQMKGFMRQRGASWELRVFLGNDPVTGKKRYATRTVRGGKREAQSALAEMITEAERGLTVRTTATVGELLDAWFGFAAPDFSPKTGDARLHRSLADAHARLEAAGEAEAGGSHAFYRRLLASGGSGGRPLAPATVRRIHGILRRALSQGVKWGWIGIDPATATTPPRVPVSDIRPPSSEALGRVLRRARDESPDLGCYLMLAAATGARRSELIALRAWRPRPLRPVHRRFPFFVAALAAALLGGCASSAAEQGAEPSAATRTTDVSASGDRSSETVAALNGPSMPTVSVVTAPKSSSSPSS